jgi:hypothetical protein
LYRYIEEHHKVRSALSKREADVEQRISQAEKAEAAVGLYKLKSAVP